MHTGILQSETIFSSILEVKAALMLLDDDGLAILKNELVKCTSSTIIIQRLVMLKADELSFFVRLLIPTIAENEWNNMLETVIAIIGRSAKHAETEYKKVKGSGLTASFLKNKVFYTLLLYILNAAKELRYVTVEKLMLVAKESLHRIIAEPQLDYEANNIIADEENKSALPDEKDLVEWKKDFKGFFIINAGICLLAPYLPAFFKELNLCDERSFYDKVRQQHAVYLLHYIATGEKDSSEENLVLAKILCGWPLLMPCVNMFEISVTEIDEATELLKTVIKYWTVLKNTSPDGLREGFLQRGGKFLEEDDNYILQVEQQSIDILLEQVPWTFRMIKLPWMKKMIQVEWY
ncbi:MAG: contractile injection system tape measure protein [Segetibacter sp.]